MKLLKKDLSIIKFLVLKLEGNPYYEKFSRKVSYYKKLLYQNFLQNFPQSLPELSSIGGQIKARLHGFGLRALFLELFFLLAASLGITLSARLLHLSYLESYSLLQQRELFLPYVVFQDIFSIALVLCGASLIGFVFSSYPRLRFTLWTLYLFIVGFCYLVNLKYYSLYAENFSWGHIEKEELLNWDLWYSFWMELDHKMALEILILSLFCLFWFFAISRFLARITPLFFHKSDKAFRNRQLLARLSLFCLSALLLFSSANSGIAEVPLPDIDKKNYNERNTKKSMQILQSKARLSNVLWNLSFAEKQELQSKLHKLLPFHEKQKSSPFRFGFKSHSLEKTNRFQHKNIPFPRKKNYNIVLYIFESTAHSYLKKKIGKEQFVTPGWQRLSKNAIVFENHYVHNPLSANSLFSLLVSSYSMPADIWAIQNYPGIPLKSLPQILREVGYQNAFMHTGYLSYAGQDKFLKNRGFHLIQDMRQLRRPPYEKSLNWGIDDRALIGAAKDFVEDLAPKQPYFLLLSPLSPHHPYDVPEEKFNLFPSEEKKEEAISALNTMEKNWEASVPKKKNSFQRYLSSLHYADSVLEKLVRTLESLPGGENTLFFILADHGEAFGQHHGNFNHPFYLYEENVHVPFMIYNAKLFPKTISYKGLSRHIDLLPTVLDSLRLKRKMQDRRHEGLSLLSRRVPQIASFYTSWRNELTGLRDGRWKYIFDLRYGKEELYDLEKDPREQENLAEKEKVIAERYRNYLSKLHAYQRKYFEKILQRDQGGPINWEAKIDKTGL